MFWMFDTTSGQADMNVLLSRAYSHELSGRKEEKQEAAKG
jgi:hypothetical protein